VRALGAGLPWATVFVVVAAAAALAGLCVQWAVPARRRPASIAGGLRLAALGSLWTDRRVRASVLGYFGHMWELYTVWVLMPTILATRLAVGAGLSWAAFIVLGGGALACIAGGLWARRVGSARVASVMLATSGACCLAAPWLLQAPTPVFALWLMVWGLSVVGDSPQFSALTATNAPPQAVGSVLTLTNSLGFAISIVSIQLFVALAQTVPLGSLLPWLGVGPVLGVWALRPLWRGKTSR
jgi:predicted MFS family arabinose efflux permease